ncbi:MAG: hypothetical protein B0A82_20765 [Alkalinema sp. CACIAM 70d]|nr:MAG: hypothetical protein B0A82_20765 [Alkalinema sp. CACIAM 70d]
MQDTILCSIRLDSYGDYKHFTVSLKIASSLLALYNWHYTTGAVQADAGMNDEITKGTKLLNILPFDEFPLR